MPVRRCPPESRRKRPPRIRHPVRRPPSWTAAAGRSSGRVGDVVDVSADVFRDGHEVAAGGGPLEARPAARRWPRRRWRRSTPTTRATAGPDASRSTAAGRWQWTVRGVDRPLRLLARRGRAASSRPARPTWPASSPRASCCCARRAGRADGRTTARRLTAVADALEQARRRATRPSTPSCAALVEAAPDRARADAARPAARRSRSTASARALRRLVRAVPALLGRLRGRRGADPAARRARLRRPLPAADPPDRPHEPQGPQQHARRRPGRPGQPVGDRRRERRPRRDPPRAGHLEDFAALVAARARARHRRSPGLRDQRARPTTRGSPSTPSGSTAAPTAR